MQKLTSAACKTATVGTEGQLIDTRDNKIYWVARLKDNNCWMTQNLDYDDPNSTRYPTPWGGTDNTLRACYDPGPISLSGDTTNDGHDLLGNYYTWMAATNGTGASATTNGANASGSICPTNWKLPTSNNTNSGSFGGLTTAYGIGDNAAGSTALRAAPLNFVYGGRVGSGLLGGAGAAGSYWSSTAYNANGAYYLFFNSSNVYPSYTDSRYAGMSVRCLVETDSTGGAIWT